MRIIACTLATILALGLAASAASAQEPIGSPIPPHLLGQPAGNYAGPVGFLAHQLTFPRVALARSRADGRLRWLFRANGLDYPPAAIFLRVFKHERTLELWARAERDSSFTLVKEYPICSLPGQLGPKRRLGDIQVPEGFYFIDRFNPSSAYLLSLRLSYPNLADRMRRQTASLGGEIFIHGGCETVGCVPIENDNIEEVYWLAVLATDAGERVIPVHVFPSRLDPRNLEWLRRSFDPEPEVLDFWRNLAQGYAYFQATHRVPWITVGPDGRYAIPDIPPGCAIPDRRGGVAPRATPTVDPGGIPPR